MPLLVPKLEVTRLKPFTYSMIYLLIRQLVHQPVHNVLNGNGRLKRQIELEGTHILMFEMRDKFYTFYQVSVTPAAITATSFISFYRKISTLC